MSGFGSADGTSHAGPPSKRRKKAHANGVDATSGNGSPVDVGDDGESGDYRDSTQLPSRSLSIRRGPPQRSRSRSRSGSIGPEGKPKRYYSSSRESRSRSRSRSRTRVRSQSRSRSRSLSRSRSRSRLHSRSRSRPRLRSHSPSDSRSRAGSRSRSGSRSSSRSSRDSTGSKPTPSASPLPAVPYLPLREPLRPNYRLRLQLRGHAAAVSQVRISPDGRWIASASADGTARIWDAATGAHMDTLVGHMAGVNCVAWSPDSSTLATGSDDKSIRLWNRVTANPAHAGAQATAIDYDGEVSGTRSAGRRAAAAAAAARRHGGAAGGVGGDAEERRQPIRGTKKALLGHSNYVQCLVFSPKGNVLASGSYDEAVFLWNVRAGVELGREPKDNSRLPAHSDPVSGVDFCCDGTLVASCSTDGLIRIWDPLTRQCLRTLVHEDNPAVTNVCFSPNGRFVLAWSLDSCIRLWDYASGTVKKTYQGHNNGRFSIGGCFGVLRRRRREYGEGDGREDHHDGDGDAEEDAYPFVASASEDGDIVLWDVRSKVVVQRIRGHDGVCFWVDVSGDTLVSAGEDGKINVFRHSETPKGKKRRKDEGDLGGRGEALEDANGNEVKGLASADYRLGVGKTDGESGGREDGVRDRDGRSNTPLRQEDIKEEQL